MKCLLLVLLGVGVVGCATAPPSLDSGSDTRYVRTIDFDGLNVSIPLQQESHVVRCDGAVDDVEAHTRTVLAELGLDAARVTMTNPGRFGRQVCLPLSDGRVCSFVWVLRDSDPAIVTARLNHEKFHSLCALEPASIPELNRAADAIGYRIDLGMLDEELAATTVEVLTHYAMGTPYVFGTGRVMEAVDVLDKARQAEPPR